MKTLKTALIASALLFTFSSASFAAGKPDLVNAAKVFSQNCAMCHGAKGEGNGPAAASLNPKPNNFTKGVFKYGSKDQDLVKTIKNGKGVMPAWGAILKDKDINDLVGYIRTLKKK